MKKILIKNDMFNIVNRLKSIDKNYYVLYNKITKKYELHCKNFKSSLQLVLPFDFLDKRTIDFVLKTKVENKQKLIQEMEENNQKLEQEKQKKTMEESNYKLKEYFSFRQNKPFCNQTDIDF